MGKATYQFNSHVMSLLDSDVSQLGGNRFYVALSKSDAWIGGVVPTVDNSLFSQREFRNKMQAVKRVSAASFVIPRVNWTLSTAYNAYDDRNESQINFYVVNSLFEVFICIEAPIDTSGSITLSTIEPTKALSVAAHPNNPAKSFKTSDGYIWRYMYKMSAYARATFLSAEWMPVKEIGSSPSILEEVEQLALQDSAVSGEIINLQVVSGGSGYGSAPTVNVSPSTSTASFTSAIYNNAVYKINLDTDGSGFISHGSSADNSIATVTGNAIIKTVQGPHDGLNKNPVESLKAKSLAVRAVIDGDEESEGVPQIRIGNDYKQYGLLLNPLQYGSSNPFTSNAGNALKSLVVNDTSNLVLDDIITQSGGSVSGVAVDKDATNIWYFQSDSGGYEPFVAGTISYQTAPDRTVTSTNNPTIDINSGKLLYIGHSDVVTGVTRNNTQSDEIRLIINLEDCE